MMGASDVIREKALFSSWHVFDSRPARAFLPMIAGAGALGCVLHWFRELFFTEFHTKQRYELQSGQQCVGLKQSWKAREGQAAVGRQAPTARLTPGLGLAHCLYSAWWIGAPNTVRVPGSFAFFLICVHYHLLNKTAQLFTAVSIWLFPPSPSAPSWRDEGFWLLLRGSAG